MGKCVHRDCAFKAEFGQDFTKDFVYCQEHFKEALELGIISKITAKTDSGGKGK